MILTRSGFLCYVMYLMATGQLEPSFDLFCLCFDTAVLTGEAFSVQWNCGKRESYDTIRDAILTCARKPT